MIQKEAFEVKVRFLEALSWDVLCNSTKQVLNFGRCPQCEAPISLPGTAVVISTYQCHFCILESRKEVEGSQLSIRVESVAEKFH